MKNNDHLIDYFTACPRSYLAYATFSTFYYYYYFLSNIFALNYQNRLICMYWSYSKSKVRRYGLSSYSAVSKVTFGMACVKFVILFLIHKPHSLQVMGEKIIVW